MEKEIAERMSKQGLELMKTAESIEAASIMVVSNLGKYFKLDSEEGQLMCKNIILCATISEAYAKKIHSEGLNSYEQGNRILNRLKE